MEADAPIKSRNMTDWQRVVDEHGGIVWKTVHRLVGDDADAADCFQEAFVAALEISRRQKIANWPGLLKRLATAKSLDRLRRKFRSTAEPLPAGDSSGIVGDVRTPATMAEERELVAHLREALAQLPREQAEACCLRFLEELSYEQIADELGVTINHVGVLLHRARGALRERLATFAPTAAQADSLRRRS